MFGACPFWPLLKGKLFQGEHRGQCLWGKWERSPQWYIWTKSNEVCSNICMTFHFSSACVADFKQPSVLLVNSRSRNSIFYHPHILQLNKYMDVTSDVCISWVCFELIALLGSRCCVAKACPFCGCSDEIRGCGLYAPWFAGQTTPEESNSTFIFMLRSTVNPSRDSR